VPPERKKGLGLSDSRMAWPQTITDCKRLHKLGKKCYSIAAYRPYSIKDLTLPVRSDKVKVTIVRKQERTQR